MKRFITYLYQYKELKKSNNTGFIKVESQSKITRMMIVIKSQTISGASGKVYLIFEDTVGILLGEIKMGDGEIRQVYEFDTEKIKDTGYGIDDVKGIRIEMPDDFMASCWTDDMEVVTQHDIIPYKPAAAEQRIVDHDDSAVLQMKQEIPVAEEKKEKNGAEFFILVYGVTSVLVLFFAFMSSIDDVTRLSSVARRKKGINTTEEEKRKAH